MLGPVGVAGCGRMGAPMLRALIRAGFDAAGFDVRPAADFGDLAPHMIEDPAAFAASRRIVLTIVRDIAQTEALLFDAQAILTRSNAIDTLLVCSTLSPRYVKELRARVPDVIALLDTPMSGAAVAAEEARLTFMLGGDAAALDRLQPLFDAMGTTCHRMGAFGAGIAAKVLNNYVAAHAIVATRTALGWADALGIARDDLLRVMRDSSGQTWFGSHFDAIEFARDGYDPDNTIGILAKDVESALAALPDSAAAGLPRALVAAIRALQPMD
jgi:3-hydroxyisobutyrate dehydrogenase